MAYNILLYSASLGATVTGSTATSINSVITSAPTQFKKQSCTFYVAASTAFQLTWLGRIYDGDASMYSTMSVQNLANGLSSPTASANGLYYVPNMDNIEMIPAVTSLSGNITVLSAVSKA